MSYIAIGVNLHNNGRYVLRIRDVKNMNIETRNALDATTPCLISDTNFDKKQPLQSKLANELVKL